MAGRTGSLTRAVALAALLAVSGLHPGAGAGQGAAAAEDTIEGQLLVASPEMNDPRFVETVIYMIRHDAEGAMGLVLNRVLGKGPIASLLEGLGIESEIDAGEIKVHYGGPVQLEMGSVLHSIDYVNEGTLVVNGAVGFTTNVEVLRDIAAGAGPARALFVFGYAGWAPGQLEAEMAANHWFTIPADQRLVFDEEVESKWDRAMAKRGVDL